MSQKIEYLNILKNVLYFRVIIYKYIINMDYQQKTNMHNNYNININSNNSYYNININSNNNNRPKSAHDAFLENPERIKSYQKVLYVMGRLISPEKFINNSGYMYNSSYGDNSPSQSSNPTAQVFTHSTGSVTPY